jgi:tetratricopeptide (TPR) repeat protein
LAFKENDALANFHMAQCYEKLDQPDEAITHFKEYLRILPQGPLAKDAKKAVEKLTAAQKQTSEKATPK